MKKVVLLACVAISFAFCKNCDYEIANVSEARFQYNQYSHMCVFDNVNVRLICSRLQNQLMAANEALNICLIQQQQEIIKQQMQQPKNTRKNNQ